MADRQPWQRAPGSLSGRIAPSRWSPTEGSNAFVLGIDEPGYTGKFVNGNSIRVYQSGTFAADSVANFRGYVRGPSTMPSGWAWQLRISIGGVLQVARTILPGRVYDMSDLAGVLTLADHGGTAEVSIGLRVTGPAGDPVELEIPAVYLDALTVDPIPGGLGIFNRWPSAGSVNVGATEGIGFSVLSTNGTAPLIADITAYVNGVLVMQNGVSKAGWSRTHTGVSSGRHVTLISPSPFDSESNVTVRVIATTGSSAVDRSWSFTIEDTSAPIIVSASSPAHDRIRVRFDEPVAMVDSTSLTDALNPANWAVTPQTALHCT